MTVTPLGLFTVTWGELTMSGIVAFATQSQ